MRLRFRSSRGRSSRPCSWRGDLPEATCAARSGHDENLPGVRILARLDLDDRREREVAHRRRARVDDLVRHFGTTRRAGDHVVLPDRVARVAEAQLALALQDQEHLLLAVVAVERALGLAGGHDRQVVAELPGSDVIADLAATGSVEAVLLHVVERDLIEVHDGLGHAVLHCPGWGSRVRPVAEGMVDPVE